MLLSAFVLIYSTSNVLSFSPTTKAANSIALNTPTKLIQHHSYTVSTRSADQTAESDAQLLLLLFTHIFQAWAAAAELSRPYREKKEKNRVLIQNMYTCIID